MAQNQNNNLNGNLFNLVDNQSFTNDDNLYDSILDVGCDPGIIMRQRFLREFTNRIHMHDRIPSYKVANRLEKMIGLTIQERFRWWSQKTFLLSIFICAISDYSVYANTIECFKILNRTNGTAYIDEPSDPTNAVSAQVAFIYIFAFLPVLVCGSGIIFLIYYYSGSMMTKQYYQHQFLAITPGFGSCSLILAINRVLMRISIKFKHHFSIFVGISMLISSSLFINLTTKKISGYNNSYSTSSLIFSILSLCFNLALIVNSRTDGTENDSKRLRLIKFMIQIEREPEMINDQKLINFLDGFGVRHFMLFHENRYYKISADFRDQTNRLSNLKFLYILYYARVDHHINNVITIEEVDEMQALNWNPFN